MNRGYFAIGAAIVLAALFGLLVALRGDPEPTAKPGDRQGDKDAKIAQADSGKPTSRPALRPPSASAPSASDTPSEPGTPVKEYVVGDVRVRDHRSGDHPPLDVPPAIHAPGGR